MAENFLSGCAELVSGVAQLAQNTALGMATVCSGNAVPPVGEPRAAIGVAPLAVKDYPATVLVGGDRRKRRFAPHASAEFADIDPRQGILAQPAIIASGVHSPGLRADQTIRRWDIHQADALSEKTPTDTRILTAHGATIARGYVFFEAPDGADPMSEGANGKAVTFIQAEHSETPPTQPQLVNEGATIDSVDPDPIATGKTLDPDQMLSRGGIMLSGGYSSIEGPSISARIVRQHIGGRDRELSASARYSKVRQILELGYAEPDFLGSSLSIAPMLFAYRTSAKGFGTDVRTTRFAQSAYGMTIQFSRKLNGRLSATANYRLSRDAFRLRGRHRTCDIAYFGSPLCDAIGGTTNSLLGLSLVYDRRSTKSGATRGYRVRLAQDIGVGGSAPYTKTRLGGEAHIGISQGWTLMLDAEGGFLARIGKRAVPLFDRFYAGSAGLRGFDLRGVGPKVRPAGAVHGQNVATGGNIYYAARAELSGSIGGVFDRYGVQPSLFVDAGSVFGAKRRDLRAGEILLGNSAKPRIAAGLGLAMKTPAGTLRIDFARPLLKQPGDRTQAFSISFGAAI